MSVRPRKDNFFKYGTDINKADKELKRAGNTYMIKDGPSISHRLPILLAIYN